MAHDNDHASWSCTCPTFLKKIEEFNLRNPNNSLQYFPTDDSWTWNTNNRPSPNYNLPPRPHPTNTQMSRRPQTLKNYIDTLMQLHCIYPEKSQKSHKATQAIVLSSLWGQFQVHSCDPLSIWLLIPALVQLHGSPRCLTTILWLKPGTLQTF